MKNTAIIRANLQSWIVAGLVVYLAATFVTGVTDKTFQHLELERAGVLSNINYYIAKIPEQKRKVDNGVTDSARFWAKQVMDYGSVEIYPVDHLTGDSLFPSILTGKMSKDDPDDALGLRTIPERLTVNDHRGLPVLRVSGLVYVDGVLRAVNADVDAFEVLKAHGIRLALHLILVIVALTGLRQASRVQNAAVQQNVDNNYDDAFKLRMLVEAMEAVEGGVCVAEYDKNTKENKIIYATRKFGRQTGYEKQDELIGRSLEVFLPEERREWHRGVVSQFMLDDTEIDRRDVKYLRKGGELATTSLDVRKTNFVYGSQLMVATTREGQN